MKINIRHAIHEYRNKGLYPLHKAAYHYLKNTDVKMSWIKEEEWHTYRTSDTIFIFGSGPSINFISSHQWTVIKENDSFGLNWAFLTRFPTTFYYYGYEPAANYFTEQVFSEDIRRLFDNSLWFVPRKVIYRCYHPRIVPHLYPPHAKIGLFDYPPAINLDSDRPFQAEDFRDSLIYRGAMGVALFFADMLQYKNIVLLGVDLHTYEHFYDHYESAKERTESYANKKIPGTDSVMKDQKVYESMIPKGNKYRTMQEYYHAVNKLYFQPKGVHLYVGNRDNMLSPEIPLYPEFEKHQY